MFLFVTNLVYTVSAFSMGSLSRTFDLDPKRYPQVYGNLVTVMTAIPDMLSVPFFIAAGLILYN